MNDEFDKLLRAESLQVPADFTSSVMARIARLPPPEFVPAQSVDGTPIWLQWLALTGGAVLGAAQLGAFMFGIWSATSVG